MDRSYSSPKNSNRACLCDDSTYHIKCCKTKRNQGIGNITGTKTKGGSFSNGFSDGFEIK